MEARFDREITLDATTLAPMVSWGTSRNTRRRSPNAYPTRHRPRPRASQAGRARDRVHEPRAGRRFQHHCGPRLHRSCTNARIEDLRIAAGLLCQRPPRRGPAIVVPCSKRSSDRPKPKGSIVVFLDAGFEWRDSSCSMCGGSNGDILQPGERSASTTNRNSKAAGTGAHTHAHHEPGDGRGGGGHGAPDRSAHAGRARADEHFVRVEGIAAPLDIAKIDTGMIAPGRSSACAGEPGHAAYANVSCTTCAFDEHDRAAAPISCSTAPYLGRKILVTGAISAAARRARAPP